MADNLDSILGTNKTAKEASILDPLPIQTTPKPWAIALKSAMATLGALLIFLSFMPMIVAAFAAAGVPLALWVLRRNRREEQARSSWQALLHQRDPQPLDPQETSSPSARLRMSESDTPRKDKTNQH